MPRIDLPSPIPRAVLKPWSPFRLQTVSKRYLPLPDDKPPTQPSFFSTLNARRTRRQLGELTTKQLSELLWHTGKVRSALPAASGTRWQHRCVPSAGGLHCIEILIISEEVTAYNPTGHALESLAVEREAVSDLLKQTALITEIGAATLIWFAADFELMDSKYEHSESLVWRDAGALLGIMCLVAEALDLGCCPIGITGEPYVSGMLNSSGRVAGVGGILMGTRMSDTES